MTFECYIQLFNAAISEDRFIHILYRLNAFSFNRPETDSSFIKILDDHTMRDTIRKTRSAFVFWHADYQRLSDSAYFKYVNVAQEFRRKSSFFVVPASVGADVARTYGIPGNPCLMHFRYGTKTGIHYGLFSEDSIRRFVLNWTTPKVRDITPFLPAQPTMNQIMNQIVATLPDSSLAVIAAIDNTTKFGKCVFELADELGSFFPFVQLSNKEVAAAFGVSFPSLSLLRFEDFQRFLYDGEADSDEMFIWTQHNSIPLFRHLNTRDLFSLDGVSQKSAVAFYDTNNID